MYFIESERLKMIPLTHELLQLLRTDRAAVERSLGAYITVAEIEPKFQDEIDDATINFWLPKTLEHPKAFFWYTTWEVILKSINTCIGGMGFIGEPNESGEVEIGYMIYKQFRNQGYATQALQLLSGWALANETVKTIIVHTDRSNAPSTNILVKCGYKEVTGDETGLMTFKLTKP